MQGDDGIFGSAVIGAIYKGVILYQHILHRTGLVPSFRISFYQDSAHTGLVIGIFCDNHLTGSSHQRTACAGTGEVAVANLHFGRAAHVLYTIMIQLQCLGNRAVQSYFHRTVGQPLHRSDRSHSEPFHSRCLDKGHRIPCEIGIKPVTLTVHEAQFQSPVIHLFHGTQVGSMHIDRVVLRSSIPTSEDTDLAAASRKVHEVSRGGQDTSASLPGSACHVPHGDISGVLADNAQSVHVVHSHILQCYVLTFVNEHPHLITDNVTHRQRIAYLGTEVRRSVKAYNTRSHFFRLGCSKGIPSMTIEEVLVFWIILYAVVPA